MYALEKQKLNKYVKVKCARPRDLYFRIGPRTSTAVGSNDGSEYSQSVSFDNSKLENLASVARDERSRMYDEYVKSQQSQTDTKPVDNEESKEE